MASTGDGKILREQIVCRIDGSLNLLLGDIHREGKIELQSDDRRAAGGARRHSAQAGHLAQLLFQRRGHRGGHHLGTGAGIEFWTWMTGYSTVGSADSGRKRQAMSPTKSNAAINKVVATGRWIKGPEGIQAFAPIAERRFSHRHLDFVRSPGCLRCLACLSSRSNRYGGDRSRQ